MYLVNAPSFSQSRIDLGGEELAIDTTGFLEPTAGGPVQYVQSVTFDGRPLARSWISARELHRGGRLQIDLGPEPSGWGTTSRPPSVGSSARPPTSPG
jgi:putative alpha-1,2-mannosidase